ncbi:multidrug efflux pump subunit AcrB [Bradyrhizobium sp. GM5.1]
MISKFFIERPVLSNVIALLMILIGGVALFNLAIAQYPDVVPPTVQVTTRYPGASAKTVIDTVALPIEQQVNGVEDMLYMQSYSGSDGTYTLTVTFKIGTDLNFAQVLVQNRVSSALSQLPQSVQNQGVTVQKRSTSILLFVTLTSPDKTFDSLYLSNYATINLRDELSRLPGVGNVTVFGAGQYSMRVWLDPNKLQVRGLVPQDVIQAIQQQSQQVSAGQVGAPPTPPGQAFQYTLNVNGRLDDTTEFENIIVKSGTSGDVTRVRDVGWVELGAQTYSQIFSLNKQPATGIGVFQSPGANALQVEQAVEKKMAQLAKALPAGHEVRHAVRHHQIRAGLGARGLHDADRGRPAGAGRDPGVPAGLARDAGAGDHCAGDHHRRLRRHGRARLHHQHVDAVRDRASDRHRRRRCHRRGGRRGPQHRAGHERP